MRDVTVPAFQSTLLPPFIERAEKQIPFYAPFTRYNNAYIAEDLPVLPKDVSET